jgi:hypothetical protein
MGPDDLSRENVSARLNEALPERRLRLSQSSIEGLWERLSDPHAAANEARNLLIFRTSVRD